MTSINACNYHPSMGGGGGNNDYASAIVGTTSHGGRSSVGYHSPMPAMRDCIAPGMKTSPSGDSILRGGGLSGRQPPSPIGFGSSASSYISPQSAPQCKSVQGVPMMPQHREKGTGNIGGGGGDMGESVPGATGTQMHMEVDLVSRMLHDDDCDDDGDDSMPSTPKSECDSIGSPPRTSGSTRIAASLPKHGGTTGSAGKDSDDSRQSGGKKGETDVIVVTPSAAPNEPQIFPWMRRVHSGHGKGKHLFSYDTVCMYIINVVTYSCRKYKMHNNGSKIVYYYFYLQSFNIYT